MKPTVEKEESGFYKFNITLATKRGLQVILAGGTFGLATAWILAGCAALYRWLERNPEPGWIIIWCIVSAVIIGVYVGNSDIEGGK